MGAAVTPEYFGGLEAIRHLKLVQSALCRASNGRMSSTEGLKAVGGFVASSRLRIDG